MGSTDLSTKLNAARTSEHAAKEAAMRSHVGATALRVLAHALGLPTCDGMGMEIVEVQADAKYTDGIAVVRMGPTGKVVHVHVFPPYSEVENYVDIPTGRRMAFLRNAVMGMCLQGDRLAARLAA